MIIPTRNQDDDFDCHPNLPDLHDDHVDNDDHNNTDHDPNLHEAADHHNEARRTGCLVQDRHHRCKLQLHLFDKATLLMLLMIIIITIIIIVIIIITIIIMSEKMMRRVLND